MSTIIEGKHIDLSAEVAQAETLRNLMGVDANLRRPKRKLQTLRHDIQSRHREINAERPGALDNGLYALSREQFDASALIESRLHYASRAPPPFDPSTRFHTTDIQGYLAHHHKTIFAKSLDMSKRVMEDTVRDMQRRRNHEDWKSAKEEFLKLIKPDIIRTSIMKSVGVVKDVNGTLSNASNLVEPGFGRRASSPISLRKTILPPVVVTHANVVRDLVTSSDSYNLIQFDLLPTLKSRPGRDAAAQSLGLRSSDVRQYAFILELLAGMVNDRPRGHFAEISTENRERQLYHGCRLALERFQKDRMECEKEESIRSGRLERFKGTRRPDVATYLLTLKLEGQLAGATYTQATALASGSDPDSTRIPLWALVYHCLLGGDINGACEELSENLNRVQDEVVGHAMDLLRTFQQRLQQQGDNNSSQSKSGPASQTDMVVANVSELVSYMDGCRHRLEREKQKARPDQYLLKVLSLLTIDVDDEEYCDTHEEWMWSRLWFVCWYEVLKQFYPTYPPYTGMHLLEEVQHFQQDDSSEWLRYPYRYLHVLLMRQAFGEAVVFLYRDLDQLFSATHVLVLCLRYGLIAPNCDLLDGIRPVHILESYANGILLGSSLEMVDYIASLRSSGAHLGVASRSRSADDHDQALQRILMSATESQLDHIVGALDKTVGQRRIEGRLDSYLNTDEVNKLLEAAGQAVRYQNGDAQHAIYLYLLAGEHPKVLEGVCTELSKVVIPLRPREGQHYQYQHQQAQDDKRRAYWMSFSKQYLQDYIVRGGSGDTSKVLSQIRRSNSEESIERLNMLLAIGNFVEAFEASKYREALQILDSLGGETYPILPLHSGDVSQAARRLDTVCRNTVIQRLLDDLMITAVSCTRLLYKQVQSANRAEADALRERGTALNLLATKLVREFTRSETPKIITEIFHEML